MSIYFPVDVNFYDSPEFFEVNMSARGLWVTCGTWCKRHLTDGVIPAKIVRHLGGTVRQIKTLIKNNVWAESEQNGTKVYIFCHWFEHNLSREEVEERRRKWRESKQRSRAQPSAQPRRGPLPRPCAHPTKRLRAGMPRMPGRAGKSRGLGGEVGKPGG